MMSKGVTNGGLLWLSSVQLHELQEAYLHTSRDLKEARLRTQALKNERRRAELTIGEVKRTAGETRLYRAIGRVGDWNYIQVAKSSVMTMVLCL